jgi:hypothetical protein
VVGGQCGVLFSIYSIRAYSKTEFSSKGTFEMPLTLALSQRERGLFGLNLNIYTLNH